MVPRGHRALIGPRRRRALAAAVAVALYIWWRGEPATISLLTLLPALIAGLTTALLLWLVDDLTTPLAGVLAAAMVMALPGFVPVHLGGPVAATALLGSILMLVAMVHAPRWSLAYGIIAALVAVFVAPEGLGLVIAAIAWAMMPHPSAGSGRRGRVLLVLTPLLVALGLAAVVGDAWPTDGGLGWHGGLDRGLRAAGTIVGDQLAPGISHPAIRFFAIADLSLILIALLAMSWRTVRRRVPEDAPIRRFYAAAATLAAGLAGGLAARRLFVVGSPDPELLAVFPLVMLGTLATVVSVAIGWPRWPRWGKVVTLILVVGWLQAAVRA